MAMNASPSSPLVQAFGDHLADQAGWHFGRERWPEMLRGLKALARETGHADPQALMTDWLRAPLKRAQLEALARHLAVGESYFFREPAALALLQEEVMRPLIAQRRAQGRLWLRLWCAGCSTGEEVYTVAMLLEGLLPDVERWDLALVGTDIHPDFLARAAHGVYREWSFRNAPPGLRARHFERRADGAHVVRPALRRGVRFAWANLAGELPPELAGMDLVLCRNVLMYFTPQQAAAALGRMREAMADDGWLLLGASEAGAIDSAGFAAKRVQDVVFLHRLEQARRPTEAGSRAIVVPAARGAELAAQARRHADEGRLDAALRWCEAALAADRDNAHLHFLHATIHEERGHSDKTRAALQRALSLDPAFVLAHFTLGRLCERLGQRHDAQRHFVQALALLDHAPPSALLPGADGMSAGWLGSLIRASLRRR
jgi:chemotaxis protein methyltransferase CheR